VALAAIAHVPGEKSPIFSSPRQGSEHVRRQLSDGHLPSFLERYRFVDLYEHQVGGPIHFSVPKGGAVLSDVDGKYPEKAGLREKKERSKLAVLSMGQSFA
jgi:hypothetical protein